MYRDRTEAGKELAQSLYKYKGEDLIILAIPRGGVVVAKEVAEALDAPMDLIIPRKIGAPSNKELAIGAVVDRDHAIIDRELAARLNVSDEYLRREIDRQVDEIKRRRLMYMGSQEESDLKDKVAILVDDGLATGSTAKAAIKLVRSMKPKKLIIAIPVGPKDTVALLENMVDEVICLDSPASFYAVGQVYEDFEQVTDDEVVVVLSSLKRSA